MTIAFLSVFSTLQAQTDRWQQKLKYIMDVTMDVEKNTYLGTQKLQYTNPAG